MRGFDPIWKERSEDLFGITAGLGDDRDASAPQDHDGRAAQLESSSGMKVHPRGALHAEWGPCGRRHDYVLFAEARVWKQILLQEG
jgi:hypothetical protein